MLLPTHAAAARPDLDRWFEQYGIKPLIAAEFQDSALMKLFGRNGSGVFPIPTIIEGAVTRELGCGIVGRTNEIVERCYLVTTEKRLRNPYLKLISNFADDFSNAQGTT
jgi:LysR family transcriptional activator of nhaA